MKKTILMVHNFYQIGGGEHTVFNNEVELLRKNGHKVIIYTKDNKDIENSLLTKLFLPFTTIWSFKTYREIKKIIKKENINIVHCHNTFPLISPSVYYAARKMKIPVIQTIHNFRFICPKALFYKDGKICEECLIKNNFKAAIRNNCYRKSKLQTLLVVLMLKYHRFLGTYQKINYIFLTDFNKLKFSKLIDLNKENVFVKQNFVEQKEIVNVSKNSNNTFIYMGRLDEYKGIKFLIEVWKEIKDYELHIYGDGEYKNDVMKACNDNTNIKYYGFQEQTIIYKDIIPSRGLIMPSGCYEGFPMTIAESFSLAVPVLASDVGNHAYLVNESKAGCIYKLNNKESFKEKIEEMILNNKKYKENARKYYNEVLTAENNYKELIKIYDKAKCFK